MQLFFLPDIWMAASFVVGWIIFQISAAFIGNRLPERFLDAGWFRPRHFESDAFYRRVFHVHRWKPLLPDGAAVRRAGFRKKNLRGVNEDYLRRFIMESKRAEAGHVIAILPFWVFSLWGPPVVIPIMLAYALAVNLPCIIAQRYNRPRFERLLKRLELKKQKSITSFKSGADIL